MKAKIIVALVAMTACASLGSPVHAQSSEATNPNPESNKLNGGSLEGVGIRDGFTKFFDEDKSGSVSRNNENSKTTPGGLRLDQTISLPDTPILLQPAQSGEGNDGVQVQLDLGDE